MICVNLHVSLYHPGSVSYQWRMHLPCGDLRKCEQIKNNVEHSRLLLYVCKQVQGFYQVCTVFLVLRASVSPCLICHSHSQGWHIDFLQKLLYPFLHEVSKNYSPTSIIQTSWDHEKRLDDWGLQKSSLDNSIEEDWITFIPPKCKQMTSYCKKKTRMQSNQRSWLKLNTLPINCKYSEFSIIRIA